MKLCFKPSLGQVEFLLLISLLFTIAVGATYIFITLQSKSRIERDTWSYAMSKAHQSKHENRNELDSKCLEKPELQVSSTFLELPMAFRTAITKECDRQSRLESRTQIPKDLHKLHKYFLSARETGKSIEFTSFIQSPGSDFYLDSTLRTATELEGMIHAGFGAIPLQLLGVRELEEAVSALSSAGISISDFVGVSHVTFP